jgi:molybdopterin-guanine dinucleotide biosynthesis protein A
MRDYAAIVLAGGGGRRLGGVDKPALPVGGRSMLHRVLDAVVDATPRIVVGPARPGLPDDVLHAREEPAGGGPVAATAAGMAAVGPVELVAVLAADLPFLTTAEIGRLRSATNPDTDVAVLVDAEGRRQWLCAVWRADALRGRLADLDPPAGRSMRELTAGRRIIEIGVAADGPPPWYDCDTEDDYRRAEEMA